MNKFFLVALLGCCVAAVAEEITLGPTGVYLDDNTEVEGGGDAQGNLTVPATTGDATLEFEAVLTTFPLPDVDDCSYKPMPDVSTYQSVEIFLVNAVNQYLEIAVTGTGYYYAALYKQEEGTRGKAMTSTNLVELLLLDVVVEVDVECEILTPTEDGAKCWSATVTIPREYLPTTKVTKYNMYLRNSDRVQAVKSGDNPALDNLANFETIALVTDESSVLWTTALLEENNDFETEFVIDQAACELEEPESLSTLGDYSATVTYTRNTEDEVIEAAISVTKGSPLAPDMDSEIDANDESIWLSFTASTSDEQLQVAVTPFGQNQVLLMSKGVDISVRKYELSGVFCDDPEGSVDVWTCTVYIPWHYLPASVDMHQILHRVPISETDGTLEVATHYSCPSDEMDNLDFVGCSVDRRLFVDPTTNDAKSSYWTTALSATTTLPPPSTDGAGSIMTSVVLLAASVALAVFAA